jgi:hypothetical protein
MKGKFTRRRGDAEDHKAVLPIFLSVPTALREINVLQIKTWDRRNGTPLFLENFLGDCFAECLALFQGFRARSKGKP